MTKPRNNPQPAGRKKWDGKDEQLALKKFEEAFAYDCTDPNLALRYLEQKMS